MNEIKLDYEQHKEILIAIVFAGIVASGDRSSDQALVARAAKVVDQINGEAEFRES